LAILLRTVPRLEHGANILWVPTHSKLALRDAPSIAIERFEDAVQFVMQAVLMSFYRWVTIFLDQAMTTALIDRLVHHSHLLIFDGESHRVKSSLMRQ
jgi:predicted DNA-binding protein (MmcQ/YjbR family)